MAKLRTGGAHVGDGYQALYYEPTRLVLFQESLLRTHDKLLRAGDRTHAEAIWKIFEQFVAEVRALALKTAEIAEEEIVKRIDRTRVRPDTARAGHPKLRDSIRAEAWDPTSKIATGTVVIGLFDPLDRLEYWRVQEYGYQFEHAPKGFFMGPGYSGSSLPNPSLFRQHPLFVPSKKGRAFISPPYVAPRHFMRDGTTKAAAYWEAQTTKAVARAIKRLDSLLVKSGLAPPKK